MTLPEYWWTALLLGSAGSLHCVGMCGAIALALPRDFASGNRILLSRVLYNLGRIVSYAVLGALFGLFGKAFVLSGLQQTVSVILGVLLFIAALLSLNLESTFLSFPPLVKFNSFIKISLGKLLKVNSQSSLFVIGILNGFLPCGFVYLGLTGSVASGNMLNGAVFMALFGLGTFPLMFITSMLGSVINLKTRNLFKKFTPAVFMLFAFLFIIRGLNLGIPYLSPVINTEAGTRVKCH